MPQAVTHRAPEPAWPTYVGDRLAMGWSPEQAAGRLRLEGSEDTAGVETIQRFIYRPAVRREKLHRFPPRADPGPAIPSPTPANRCVTS